MSVAGVLLLGVAGAAALQHDGRADISLDSFIRPSNGLSAYLPGGHDATDRYCADGSCMQAIEASTAVIRKFPTQAEAEAAAAPLGPDGHLSGWIVVHYKPGQLSESERAELEQGIDMINVDSPD